MNDPIVVYVDVDDTLVQTVGGKRIPIPEVVSLVKKLAKEGAVLYCWSAGGAEYAEEVAKDLNIANCFSAFLPKPEILVDDMKLESWWLHELHPDEVDGKTGARELQERLSGVHGKNSLSQS